MMLCVFALTNYLTTGTFLIEAKDSYFAFSEMDLVMSGGCTPCHTECKKVLLQMATFHHEALMSKPTFEDLYTATSWDYSILTAEALALAGRLEASGAICSGGVDEWGSPLSIITGEAEEVVEIIETLQLSVAPQQVMEARKGIELKDQCVTKWAVEGHLRLFKFQAVKNSIDYSSIPAADFNVFPEYTECRPVVSNEGVVGEKLALATGGEDPVLVVPDLLKLFPYSFTSSIPAVSRVVATSSPTVYSAKTVTQSLFRAYYSGCRVRTVNTTGIYVEDTCTLSKRWQNYGLMLQAPDDIPVCSTGAASICIHNNYNSLWEWVTGTDSTPGRALMKISVFRNRYADTVALSVLPGMVVLQMLLMGMISLYQIMSHKRSVLLTQIWAYRCQNGRMQVLYLAQVTYHLAHNSDTYYLGLVTGTLTVESLANLTFSFFAFSYSFINLLKARSGVQKLDRHFRLTWEIMQVIITTGVASILYSSYLTSLPWIVDYNGKLLRKTTVEGATHCGLHDSCIVMRLNLAIMAVIASTLLGLAALSASYVAQKHSRPWEHVSQSIARIRVGSHVRSFEGPNVPKTALEKVARGQMPHFGVLPRARFTVLGGRHKRVGPVDHQITTTLTTFEEYCLGSEFTKLFMDCDDFAYVMFMNKRCTSVEALLLTGYLFYGKHVYQAPSVVLLLLARLFPPKFLRTFNILLLRWWVHPDHGTLTHALSCTWYTASEENYWISEATPIS
ncbi:NADP-dependent alcohol dehydrogenase C 2 [Phytophthora cinnamomi]|uniref:NADP-dependent alcohol dehydrogenase C 2 n=1 Tax=Phytophthora cinnamomi TaxID=4785 RepID=UPI0035599EE0|nr:NADP-dependent alcohol dehydrogenase C 2 [Phytophthora cinnamomi]